MAGVDLLIAVRKFPCHVTVGEPAEGSVTHSIQCHDYARNVVAMDMTFRRLHAWPRVGGGFVDCGQRIRLPLS